MVSVCVVLKCRSTGTVSKRRTRCRNLSPTSEKRWRCHQDLGRSKIKGCLWKVNKRVVWTSYTEKDVSSRLPRTTNLQFPENQRRGRSSSLTKAWVWFNHQDSIYSVSVDWRNVGVQLFQVSCISWSRNRLDVRTYLRVRVHDVNGQWQYDLV